ncbi:translocation/assembly module TamB domain-containing protein [Chryseosolibacter indicus]|uniref:Translocation/assembly module TamB domain-containing protein n=1 Tax=Chryseosolibacter indicus TaxID=2782351 RepID=A0ABS5VRM4_9BACT|nr:translocation/assembly module TamB domain-containing protein [Chryseosolibacter indicus]MBT1703499.1 translocation/assembly module TamB domain-containing protein [Chryseosolibacter indicus]
MNAQVIKNRLRKALIYTFSGIVFLIITLFLVLQIPSIQEKLVQRYLGDFSNVTGFTSTIEGFQLLWFDRLELENVKIFDPEQNKMISAKKILINFKLSHLFEENDVNIDGVSVEEAEVYITNIQESDTSRNLNINVFVDRINEKYSGAGDGGGKNPRINIGEAILSNSQFSYIDQDKPEIKNGFNYNQFSVDINEAQLQNFLILGDTTQFNVNTLLAKDKKTNFSISHLSTFFRLCQKSMEFSGLNLQAGQSTISDTIIFTFDNQRALNDFIPEVDIHGSLINTIIQPSDLALFAPEAARLTAPISLTGIFNGRINDFKFTNMEIGTGRTSIRGSLDMEGLPDITETFIILRLKDSKLDFNDLSFLFNDEVMEQLVPVGRVTLQGEFLGYPTDFVAKGEFNGNLGRLTSDINFKVNEQDFDKSSYSGKISLYDFNLGKYLKDTANFQYVNLTGNVAGSGLTLSTADFKLNGRVSSIGLRKYNYKNITTNARFASQLFNGYFKINDPNLQFTARGSLDLRKDHNTIKMQAQLDTAYLDRLKLIDKPIFLHSKIDIDVKGLNIDSIVGRADLQDFKISYNNKWLELEKIHVNSQTNENRRSLEFETNLVGAQVNGDFLMSDITRDISTLVDEILMNIENDKEVLSSYYRSKTYRPKTYQTNFRVNVHDADPIIKLFDTDLQISKHTTVDGKFTSGYTSILQAFAKPDSLTVNNTLFLGTDIELTASKIADSTNVLAMAFVNSEKQIFTSKFRTKNLVAEAIWNKNHIEFGLDGDQDGEANYLRLKGAVDFDKDTTYLKILPSKLKVLDKVWEFDPQNIIAIQRKDYRVKQLTLRNENQFISVNGSVSPDTKKKLSLQVEDFDLSSLNPVIGRELTGTLNAFFDVSNIYHDPFIQNNLTIDSLTVDKFLVGDISGKNEWDTLQRNFILNFFIDRNNTRIIDVDGLYTPADKESPLDVTAKLKDANLKILEPFLEEIFSNIGGTATGDFKITGVLAAPAIQGEGRINNGQITLNYLKTNYQFTGIVGLTPKSIYFKNIQLTDLFNNKGRLSGTITHNNFYSMHINIDASFENFQVLNTTAKDNTLFYGQGYATGDLNLFGPIAHLKITANARTDRNTRIFIPIGGESEVEKKEFIKFVSLTDSTFQNALETEINNKIDLTGITMDFNLDVTPDAYCEIILDLKAGDIIRGRGNGELQLQFDTKGEFSMFGPFEFTEGGYNFTLYDIVNKEFEIKRGSRINWYGDPYEGILNISATYNQLASFAPILIEQELSTEPQLRRKYPVMVLLQLEGAMLSPNIKFDIVAGNLPTSIPVSGGRPPVRLDFEFNAFKNRIDEQELTRQVFSLIVLRRFSAPESFNTSGSDVTSSVSEFLSNQLSSWASQVDENLEIDIDLSSFDQEAFNTFQLRLSYTFMNGRLRITRDGTFYSNQSEQTTPANPTYVPQNNAATLAGDWTVDYLLTPDGKLKVKAYNRANLNPIYTTLGSQNSVTTGVSLLHTQTFNRLRDLWKTSRKRREEESDVDDVNQEAIKEEDDGTE